jgi:hypothetical protein
MRKKRREYCIKKHPTKGTSEHNQINVATGQNDTIRTTAEEFNAGIPQNATQRSSHHRGHNHAQDIKHGRTLPINDALEPIVIANEIADIQRQPQRIVCRRKPHSP